MEYQDGSGTAFHTISEWKAPYSLASLEECGIYNNCGEWANPAERVKGICTNQKEESRSKNGIG